MNKKKLVVAIACVLCTSLSQQIYAANDIEIVSGSVQTNITGGPDFTSTNDSAQLGWDEISGHLDNPYPNYVTISTTESGNNVQDGDVNVNGVIDTTGLPSNGVLEINAHNDINLNANISGTNYHRYEFTPDSDGLNGGVVNLNADFGSKLHTTVNGGLVIGASGSYNLESSSSLTAGSVDNSSGGTFNFTGGSLQLNNSGVAIDSTGLLGADVNMLGIFHSFGSSSYINYHDLQVVSQSVGTSDPDSGTITVGDYARNIVDGTLTINSGGTYNLDGGRLEAAAIINNGGALNFTSGVLEQTAGTFAIEAGGSLGDTSVVGGGPDAQSLYTVNQSVGTETADSGTFTLGNNGRNQVSGTLTINAGGTYNLDGGSLNAGDIVDTGSFNFTSGDLTLVSALVIESGGLLGADVVLNSGRTLRVDSQSVGTAAPDSGTLTISGSNYNSYQNTNYVTNGLTVEAGGTVTLNSGELNAGTITNNGQFNFNGGELTLRDQGMTIGTGGLLGSDVALNNTQSLRLENDNVLTIDAGSTLTLDGGYFQVGSVVNDGSFVFNSGRFNMTDSPLTIGSTGLLGTNTVIDGSKVLDLIERKKDIYDDWHWVGNDINIETGSQLSVEGGVVEARAITGGGTVSILDGGLYLMSDIAVGTTSPFGDQVVLNSGARLDNSTYSDPYGSHELLIESGGLVRLNGGTLDVGSINNQGTFEFNSGTLELSGEDFVVGTTGLMGDNVTLNSGQSVGVTNTSRSTVVEAGATLTMNGGSLRGIRLTGDGTLNFNSGHISLYSGATIGASSLLGDNLVLTDTRRLTTDSTTTVESGATLRVNSGTHNLDYFNNNGTVVISGGDIRTTGYRSARYENNGTTVIRDGSSLVVDVYESNHPETYVQNTGTTVVDGLLRATTVSIVDGTLRGSGLIDADVSVEGGRLLPGNSSGALEITGDLVLTEAGTVHMEVGSDGLDPAGYLYDQLIVGGDYDLQGGLLKFSLLDGIDIFDLESDFTIGDFFRSGTAGTDTAFDLLQLSMFNNLDLYAYDALGESWFSLALNESTGGFIATASVAPVPIPAAVWLFGSGLIGLFGVARRKAT